MELLLPILLIVFAAFIGMAALFHGKVRKAAKFLSILFILLIT